MKIFRKSLAQPQRERGPEASRDMNKYLERYQRSIDTPLDYRGVVPDLHLSSYTNQYKDLKETLKKTS